MPDEVRRQGERVVEMFAACAAAPDDRAVAETADAELAALEELLTGLAAEDAGGGGDG
ncbi:hypothetical protein [Streptomyces sp. GbtcB6]|uniref:hypothetical protein n=1 Tax=Streptomyces sp. GbtcB6 TaxID=2824751 RepID=UPI001C30FE47|nr:hypothetical protein [Streptomyces sp. GbtcB6]